MKFSVSRDPKYTVERYKVVSHDTPCCITMAGMIQMGCVGAFNNNSVSICPIYDDDCCEAVMMLFCPGCGERVYVEEIKQDG